MVKFSKFIISLTIAISLLLNFGITKADASQMTRGVNYAKSLLWYNVSWLNRKQITIGGTADGDKTNYQLKLNVYKSVGSDSGSSVYLGTKVKDDFSDLRFTQADGTTLLDYWIESYVNATAAVVWIECNSIPTGQNINFYIYYNYSSASSVSSGDNTFPFFDDFNGTDIDTNKWGFTYGALANGKYSLSSGILTITDSPFTIQHVIPAMARGAVRFRYYTLNTSANGDGMIVYAGATTASNFQPWWQSGYNHIINWDTAQSAHWVANNPSSYALVDYCKDASELQKVYIGGTLQGIGYTNTYDPTKIDIGSQTSSALNVSDIKIDWILTRNYTTNEPTWGTWGNEENPSTPYIPKITWW